MAASESQLPRSARAEISYEAAGVTLSRLHGYWMVLPIQLIATPALHAATGIARAAAGAVDAGGNKVATGARSVSERTVSRNFFPQVGQLGV